MSALYSAVRARRCLQLGCSGFLAYMADTRIRGTTMLNKVTIVWDFLDVFPEDLLGVTPERQIKF